MLFGSFGPLAGASLGSLLLGGLAAVIPRASSCTRPASTFSAAYYLGKHPASVVAKKTFNVYCSSLRGGEVPKHKPGVVRDAIMSYFRQVKGEATVAEIHAGVSEALGEDIPRSSVRSYLNLNTPRTFQRTARGKYRLAQW